MAIQHVFSIDAQRMISWFSSCNNAATSLREVMATAATSSDPAASSKRRGRPPLIKATAVAVSMPPSLKKRSLPAPAAPDAVSAGTTPDRSVGDRGGPSDGPAARTDAGALLGVRDGFTPQSIEKDGEAAAGSRGGIPGPAPAAQPEIGAADGADAGDKSDMVVMKVHRSHLPSIRAVLQRFYPASTQGASQRAAQPPPHEYAAICSNKGDSELCAMFAADAGEPEPLAIRGEDQLMVSSRDVQGTVPGVPPPEGWGFAFTCSPSFGTALPSPPCRPSDFGRDPWEGSLDLPGGIGPVSEALMERAQSARPSERSHLLIQMQLQLREQQLQIAQLLEDDQRQHHQQAQAASTSPNPKYPNVYASPPAEGALRSICTH